MYLFFSVSACHNRSPSHTHCEWVAILTRDAERNKYAYSYRTFADAVLVLVVVRDPGGGREVI